MSKCIVGYSGFVGGNLLLHNKFDYFFNSKNFDTAINLDIDTMYFCGIPATKWYANKNPEEDSNNINNIMNILKTIKIKKIILISTIDVYDNIDGEYNEDYTCDYMNNHIYGKNRFLFEEFIKENFTNYYIVRLPALFGYGLKKNIIYDLINKNQINKININTNFQWYDLNWLNKDIETIIENNIRICNLFTEPIETINIVKLFDYSIDLYDNNNYIKYDLKTKYSSVFNCNNKGYIRTKEEVVENLIKYINFEKINKDKLCVSNICINDISQFQLSCILKVLGFKNVEIAPTKLINWKNLNDLNLNIYYDNNLNVYSYQSITFTLVDYNIFNQNNDILFEHIKSVIDSAYKNNIKIIVFGCPRNRFTLNENHENNKLIFIDFFRKIGDYCKSKNVIMCIEPNSKKYNCNFLNTIQEVINIVKEINNTNIKMMVDLGNVIMENDNLEHIIGNKDILYHIHVSQEYMIHFEYPNNLNYIFKKYLDLISYNSIITLEMLIKENELNVLIKSLINFINIYGKKI
jgi:sugar phosphate isomerase/epimerase